MKFVASCATAVYYDRACPADISDTPCIVTATRLVLQTEAQCAPPVNFQSDFNAPQNHPLHTIH